MKHLKVVVVGVVLTIAMPVWGDEAANIDRAVVVEGGDPQKVVDALAELAMDQLAAGHFAEAVRTLVDCLRLEREPKQWSRATLQKNLEEARKHVGALRLALNEPDAIVKIDEQVLYRPLAREIYLEPGRHKIQATKEGFEPYETEIVVKAGEERMISLLLVPEGEALHRNLFGVPTKVQLSVEGKMSETPKAPLWPPGVMIGSGIGIGVSATLIVTGLVKTSNAKTDDNSMVWQSVTIGGGVLGGLSLAGLVVGAVGWAMRPTTPPNIIVQPVITHQTTGAAVSGHW